MNSPGTPTDRIALILLIHETETEILRLQHERESAPPIASLQSGGLLVDATKDRQFSDQIALKEKLLLRLRAELDAGQTSTQDQDRRQVPEAQATLSENRKALVCKVLERGITKAELYKSAGVDKSEYYKWERGKLPAGPAVDQNLHRAIRNKLM